MPLTPEQLQAAAAELRTRFSNGFEWENIPDAMRVAAEHVERLDLHGKDKRAAAISALRDLVSRRVDDLLKKWRGPAAFGLWAYPVLAIFVYPVIRRVAMWAFDELAPKFLDLLIDASKGRLDINKLMDTGDFPAVAEAPKSTD